MIKTTKYEFYEYLKTYNDIFHVVRFLDYKNLKWYLLEDDGSIKPCREKCYLFWNKTAKCKNCISENVLLTKERDKKFEIIGDEIYQITSQYFEVDDEPYIVELIDLMGDEIVHTKNMRVTLFEAMNEYNNKIYLDVNLNVYNRRYFEEQFTQTHKAVAIAMLDLDFFKDINDNFGHKAGDLALETFVDAVKKEISSDDIIIRFGGDEFFIAFTHINENVFGKKLESIRKAVEMATISEYPEIRITTSIGGCYCDEYSQEALYIADDELYAAKANRNCVSFKIMGEPEVKPDQTLKTESVENSNSNKPNRQKKKVLIVDNNKKNRTSLTELLENEYDVMTAENGKKGLEILRMCHKELSLVLLDIYMPICDGYEFLKTVRDDKLLSAVPIIVTTDFNRLKHEEHCIELGAIDFITRPYNTKIVLGRIGRIIRFHESVAKLSAIEYDSLSGLYTIQAFMQHANEEVQAHSDDSFDLMVMEIHDLEMYNRVFGKQSADSVLIKISQLCKPFFEKGLATRTGNKYILLCLSQYAMQLDEIRNLKKNLYKHIPIDNISLRFGIYRNIDKTKSMKTLCDRVLMTTASNNINTNTGIYYYDEKLIKKVIRNHKLVSDFYNALQQNEFQVWYQPKVDLSNERIVGAEALVRWFDKNNYYVPPSEFIPTLEQNGLISALDEYVFKQVCIYQRTRIDAHLNVVPISVNISRRSLFQSGTAKKYQSIAQKIGVPLSLIPLEITESFSIDEKIIIKYIKEFDNSGFYIHMDDFGTGASSIHSLSSIPFDVMKLDKVLIDEIGTRKGEIILKNIIIIAHELGIRVVAEGVEHFFQLRFLKDVGCDYVQGFIYSPPKCEANFNNQILNGFKSLFYKSNGYLNCSRFLRFYKKNTPLSIINGNLLYLKMYNCLTPIPLIFTSAELKF